MLLCIPDRCAWSWTELPARNKGAFLTNQTEDLQRLKEASSNKCIAASIKCLTSSNKKLLETSAALVVTGALLVVTRSY